MSSILDRRDKQIWDAIEHDNLKQALQLCQKRIKRGEKGEYLLALRAYILAHGPSAATKAEATAEIKSLGSREPVITDVNVLTLVQEAADINQQDVSGMWERAVRARPKDEELPKEWFFTSFQTSNWKDAQKAAMTLQKAFPKNRAYYFWAVLCCHLLNVSHDTSDSDRKLFGMLAYRMISKAASEVPSDPKDGVSPPRAVQTSEELQLLLAIYRRQGRTKESLDLLKSETLGIHSKVAKGDWNLVRQKLDLLEEEASWQEEYDFCQSLIDSAYPEAAEKGKGDGSASNMSGDDWRVWQGLARALHGLTTGDPDALEKVIARYQSVVEKSRNTQLGLVLLSSIASPRSEEFLSSCKDYFDTNSRTLACFDDLKPFVEKLSHDSQAAFKSHIRERTSLLPQEDMSKNAQIDFLTAKINALKFRYLLDFSIPDHVSEPALEDFAVDCVKTYLSSLPLGRDLVVTDNRPGDDACILAVMALIRLIRLDGDVLSSAKTRLMLLQATLLLEFLVSDSKHNYQGLLLLVRCYLLLGAGSRAMITYPRLAIKQIQNDTLAHYLFSRLASIHPQKITLSPDNMEKSDTEPFAGFERLLQVYDRSDSQLPRLKKLALEHGSYSQIEGFYQFQQRVQTSICKWMWLLERRRVARLTSVGNQVHDDLPDMPQDILDTLSDNRDFDVVINLEATGRPRFEEYLRVGPRQNRHWIGRHLQLDRLFQKLVDATQGAVSDRHKLPTYEPSSVSDGEDMTPVERSWACLPDLISKAVENPSSVDESLEAKIISITDTLRGAQVSTGPEGDMALLNLDSAPCLDWVMFYESFVALDHLKLTNLYLKYVKKEVKKPPANLSVPLKELEASVASAQEALRAKAIRHKNRFSAGGVVGGLVEGVLGRDGDSQTKVGMALEELLGEPWIETFVGSLVDSWQEALDGILKIKL